MTDEPNKERTVVDGLYAIAEALGDVASALENLNGLVAWKRTGLTKDDISQPSEEQGSSPVAAEEFLLTALKEGPVDSVLLKKLAKDGFGIGETSLWRAFKKLQKQKRADHVFEGFGSNRKVFWKLLGGSFATAKSPIDCSTMSLNRRRTSPT